MNEGKSLDYIKGWQDAVNFGKHPKILAIEEVDDLLKKCEIGIIQGPSNSSCDMIVPAEALHELLMLWKIVRLK